MSLLEKLCAKQRFSVRWKRMYWAKEVSELDKLPVAAFTRSQVSPLFGKVSSCLDHFSRNFLLFSETTFVWIALFPLEP